MIFISFWSVNCWSTKYNFGWSANTTSQNQMHASSCKTNNRVLNPEHILYVGTNDLNTEKAASHISKSILDLANSLKNGVYVSVIVP